MTTTDISLVGIGFNPDKDLPTTASLTNLEIDASNVRVSGLVIDRIDIGNISGTGNNTTGISIDGCQVREMIAISSDDFVDNVIVRNCLLGNNVGNNGSVITANFGSNASNVIITNNIIVGSISSTGRGSITIHGGLVKNNLFIGDANNANAIERRAFDDILNSTVSNNIFYGRSPQAHTSSSTNVFNSNAAVGVLSGQEVFPPLIGTGDTEDGNNLVAIRFAVNIFRRQHRYLRCVGTHLGPDT